MPQFSRGAAQANSHGLQPVVAKKDMIEAPKERRRLTIRNAFAPLGLCWSLVDILPGLKSRAICLHRFAVEDRKNRAEQHWLLAAIGMVQRSSETVAAGSHHYYAWPQFQRLKTGS